MIKTHTFCGKKYDIHVGEKLDGFTDTDNHYGLVVERDLKSRVGLETTIHEALHACSWSTPEDKVEKIAYDIARFLWRLGYRKVK